MESVERVSKFKINSSADIKIAWKMNDHLDSSLGFFLFGHVS